MGSTAGNEIEVSFESAGFQAIQELELRNSDAELFETGGVAARSDNIAQTTEEVKQEAMPRNITKEAAAEVEEGPANAIIEAEVSVELRNSDAEFFETEVSARSDNVARNVEEGKQASFEEVEKEASPPNSTNTEDEGKQIVAGNQAKEATLFQPESPELEFVDCDSIEGYEDCVS